MKVFWNKSNLGQKAQNISGLYDINNYSSFLFCDRF